MGNCAATWPPMKVPEGADPEAGKGVRESLLGTMDNPVGGEQVTYNRWPLYTYVGDKAAGEASGHGIDRDGGLWYAQAPNGLPAKKTRPGDP